MRDFLLMSVLLPMLLCCQSPSKAEAQTDAHTQQQKIEAYKLKLKQIKDKKGDFPADSIMQLVQMYQDYAEGYPADSLSPVYLFKGADLAQGYGEPGKGIMLYGKLWRNYPKHQVAVDALFMQAFLFENSIGDLNNAYSYYKKVIAQYPAHPLAKQAQVALQNLGKSPEELIRQFEEKKPQSE